MKSDIVAGLNYQDKKDKRISEWVKYSRKMALAPVHKFAKDHHISGTLVKKYESGEYDSPTPLIAANFCKNFDILPEELIKQFKLSDDKNFDSKEYLQTLNSYYFNTPTEFTSIGSVKQFLDLKSFDDFPQTASMLAYNIPCEAVFANTDGDRIAGAYFKYEKVHKDQMILDAYKTLANSISYALSYTLTLKDPQTHEPYDIQNYLFVTSSKNAFNAIYEERKNFVYNHTKSNNCPINLTLLLLPKFNSTKYYYFPVTGKDFLKVSEYVYNSQTVKFDEQ